MPERTPCPSCGHEIDPDARQCPACGTELAPDPTAPDPVISSTPAPTGEPEADGETVELLREALEPNYLLVGPLDRGGMASVYLARDPALKRDVAVKVLSEELSRDETARKRFEREAQAAASISHPNVVPIYSVGELANGRPYFVMRYVAGRSLEARLQEEGPLPVDDARQVMGQVASALAAAHRREIIHRDIKPANVLYDEETGEALVSDFGIASVAAPEDTQEEVTELTQTGTIIGTPGYMSPEQLLGDEVTEPSDLYSLGLLAYRVLAGEGPFEARSTRELIAAILRDEPKKLSGLREDVDPELEAVVESCLDREPERRPSAEQVARRLAPRVGVLEWPPPGLERVRGKTWKVAALAAVGGALLVLPLLFSLAGKRLEPGWLLVSAGALGLVASLAAAGWLALLAWRGVRATQLGYGWLTVTETLADQRGDTGALIAGTREYAKLGPEARDRLRVLRVGGGLAAILAALWPIPGLVGGVYLGSRAVLGPTSLLVLVLGPVALLLLVAGLMATYEARRVRVERRALRQRRSLRESIAGLIAPWYASFESVRRGERLGPGSPGRRALVWSLGGGLALATGLGALMIFPLFATPEAASSTLVLHWPEFSGAQQKLAILDVVRPYRLKPDPRTTPVEAGRALQVLSFGETDRPMPEGVREPERRFEAWSLPPGQNPFGERESADAINPAVVIPVAIRGLTVEQREYLERAASHPGQEEFARLARAPAVDIAGTRYELPFPDTVHPWTIPIPRFRDFKDYAYGHVAKAALRLSEGRSAEAETAAREILSVGLLLADEAHTLLDALIGIRLGGIGRGALIEVYRATGREAEAGAISAAVDSVISATPEPPSVGPGRIEEGLADIRELRRRAYDQLLDPQTPRPIRWSVLGVLEFAPCTNAQEFIFGPNREHRRVVEQARKSLVRYDSDAEHFRVMNEIVERTRPYLLGSRLPLPIVRAVTAIGGKRAQGCAGMIMWSLDQ